MNLFGLLQARMDNNNPNRVGLIGSGKFGTMFLSQALNTPGIHIIAIADLNPDRTKKYLAETGWPPEKYAAISLEKARENGSTHITDDSNIILSIDDIDVIVEFPDKEAGQNCLKSDAYQQIIAGRLDNTTGTFIFVEGV